MKTSLIPAYNDNYIFHLLTEDGLSIVVDPGGAQPVINYLDKEDLTLQVILHTHHHWDHINGDKKLQEKYNCEIWGPEHEIMRIPNMSVLLEDEQTYTLGASQFKVLHTPGHTRGHIILYFEKDNALFCGDTLFSLGCGRLFEGTAEEMWSSVQKIRTLPNHTKIYCAHEYTLENALFWQSIEPNHPDMARVLNDIKTKRDSNISTIPTTLEFEKKYNPFLRVDDPKLVSTLQLQKKRPKDVFAHIRKLRDNI